MRSYPNILAGIFLAGLLLSCGQQPATDVVETKPNFIFIMADDLGYGDVGIYGQTMIKTPNIDQLATDGMTFTQFYAGTSVCAPSRSVLMTGLHSGHTQIRGNKQYRYQNGQLPLPDSAKTVAEYLQEAGYTTGMIGKWGLGDPNTTGDPAKQGWDHYFGYTDQVLAHNYYPEYLWRNGEKVMLDNEVQYLDTALWHDGLGSYSTGQVQYSHDLFMEETLQFLDENRDRSFFLYLPFTIPHDNGEQLDTLRFEVPDQGEYANEDWARREKDYAAMITRMDHGIGRMVDFLDQAGLSENTLIFFTSDNGPMKDIYTTEFFNSNGPLRGSKRDLYEGGMREPFLVKWPGQIEAGSHSDHLGGFWDILPTLLDLAGEPIPEHVDGISIKPTLLGQDQRSTHQYLYWEFHEGTGSQAIRQGDWKAVKLNIKQDPNFPTELYNLATDLGEETNLADQHPDKLQELEQLMKEARIPSPEFPLAIDSFSIKN
jgi:arylsulfatase A-like enzyme